MVYKNWKNRCFKILRSVNKKLLNSDYQKDTNIYTAKYAINLIVNESTLLSIIMPVCNQEKLVLTLKACWLKNLKIGIYNC